MLERRHVKYSNRIFRIFIKSYMCILLIPIIICAWAYASMYHSSLVAERKYLEYALSQFSIAFDGELNKIQAFASAVMLDQETADISMMNPPAQNSAAITHAMRYKNKLSVLRASSPLMYDQLVYLDKPGILFSTDGKVFFNSAEYRRGFVNLQNIIESDWLQIIRTRKSSFYPSGQAAVYSISPKRMDAAMNLAVYTSPLYFGGVFRGSVIVLMKESAFTQLYNQYLGSDYKGVVGVYDDAGRAIFSNTVEDLGDDVLKISNISSVYPLRYVAELPNRIALRNAQTFLRFSVILLSCALVVGGALAYAFARKYGRPLDQLNENLRALKESGQPISHRQAIRELDTRVQVLILSHRDLSAYLSEHTRVAERLVFEKLCEGSFEDEERIHIMLGQLNIPAIVGPMVLVLFSINKLEGEVILEDSGQFAAAMREAAGRHFPGAAHRFDVSMSTIAFILPYGDSQEADAAIRRTASDVAGALSKPASLFLQCIVSDPVFNYLEIGHMFGRCSEVQSGRLWSNPVVHLSDIRRTSQFHYPLDEETRLINAVMRGNAEAARAILDRLYQVNYGDAQKDIRSMKMALNSLSGTLNRVWALLDPEQEQALHERIDRCVDQLEYCGTPSELFELTAECLEEIIREREDARIQRQTGRTRAKAQQIKAFVEENYANPGMGLTLLAEEFGLSEAYLSRLFKEQEGVNLSEHIEKTRVERAKEMLLGEDSIERVAERVGYSHVYSFRMAFKRVEGMTPGVYREERRTPR